MPTAYQENLWRLDHFQGAGAAYNEPTGVRLTGPLDVPALQQSLNAILQRHEVLRTRFVCRKGWPVEVVEPDAAIELPVTDLSSVDARRRDKEVQRLAAAEARIAFDLEAGPPMRARLFRFAEQRHLLVVTIHHLVFDGRSQEILLAELAQLYQANCNGVRPELPALRWQYSNFVAWRAAQQKEPVCNVIFDGS